MNYLPASEELPADEAEPPASWLRVEVTNQTDRPVDADRIEAAVRRVLAGLAGRPAEVSVAIVDDGAIHRLNRQFLAHDYPTDVLSFVLEDDPKQLAGEIVVSVDVAERTAAEVGWSAADELLLYVVHGALHLAGFRDQQPREAAAMRAAEAAALDGLGVRRSPRDERWHSSQQPRTGEEMHAT